MMETKSEYMMTDLGEIPVDWEIKELKNISDIVTGSTPKTNIPNLWGGNYMFVTPSDMNGQQYMYNTERYITDEALKLSRVIPKNSIMVTCIASIGKMAIATEECITNQQINTIIPSPNYYSKYLYYYLLKSKSKLELLASQTTVPIINKNTFSKFKVILPSLKEQQKIAEILSTVDEQIEQTDQLIEKTKELKKGLMQQLLTKGIGHTEFKHSEIGEIPVEWEVKELKKVLEKVVGGGTPSRKNSEFYVGNIPWITVKDMKGHFYQGHSQESINEDAIKKSATNLIEPGNVVIATRMALGKGFINTKSIAINQDLKALYLNQDKVYNPYFLYWYVSNAKQIESLGSGTTVKGIRVEQLTKLKMPLPPTEEQKKIAEILSSVDEDIEGYEEEKAKYEELKKGLMQQLLTGKTRVKVD